MQGTFTQGNSAMQKIIRTRPAQEKQAPARGKQWERHDKRQPAPVFSQR